MHLLVEVDMSTPNTPKTGSACRHCFTVSFFATVDDSCVAGSSPHWERLRSLSRRWVHAGAEATRALRFDNLHNNVKLSAKYLAAGRYLPVAT